MDKTSAASAKRHIRVAFVGNMDHWSIRMHYAGALHFAAKSGSYAVKVIDPHACETDLQHQRLALGKPDAIVVCRPFLPFARRLYGRAKRKLPPIVAINKFDQEHCRSACDARVLPDEDMLVKAVASRFMSRCFTHFAYLGVDDYYRSLLREKLFRAAIASAGHEVNTFRIPWLAGHDDGSCDNALKKWLHDLPKPCAVMVYWDILAQKALMFCRELGIQIPAQLSIISVDNTEEICESTVPTLSSIEPDFRAGGYLAMTFVERLLRSPRPAGVLPTAYYGIRRFVERASSRDVHGAARIVVAAQDFIRRNATFGIRTRDVATALNISQRLLELHFANVLKRPPHEEIQHVRLQTVKELLRTTNLPLEAIAERAGYTTLHHLQNLFKARFGMPLGAYRRSFG